MSSSTLQKFISPLEIFYNRMMDGVIISSLDGKVSFVNKSFASWQGRSADAFSGCNYSNLDLAFTENKALIYDGLDKFGMVRINNESLSFSDAKKKSKDTIYSYVRNSEHDGIGLLTIIKQEDLIHPFRKEGIYGQNALLRAINSKKDEIWFVTDIKEGRNTFCTDSIETILGWSKKEYVEGSWGYTFARIHPDDHPLIHAVHVESVTLRNKEKFIHDGVPVVFEVRKLHSNGSWRWIRLESTVFERDENQEVKSFIGFMRDITEEKEQQLLEEKKEKIKTDLIEILHGEPYVNLAILKNFLNKNEPPAFRKSEPAEVKISSREQDVLKLIVNGDSTKQISVKLFITDHTVNMHRKQLMKKLGAKNLAELVRIALEKGLI